MDGMWKYELFVLCWACFHRATIQQHYICHAHSVGVHTCSVRFFLMSTESTSFFPIKPFQHTRRHEFVQRTLVTNRHADLHGRAIKLRARHLNCITLYIHIVYIHIDCKTNMSTPGAASDSAGVQKKPDTDSELLDTALLLENLEANAKQMADSLAYISGGLRVNLHAVRGTMSVNWLTPALLLLRIHYSGVHTYVYIKEATPCISSPVPPTCPRLILHSLFDP